MTFHSYRKRSREDWGYKGEDAAPLTIEQINAGCMLRIADATEKMAANYVKLQSEVEYLKRCKEIMERDNDRLRRRISASRGVITKLKKQLANGN